MTKPRTPAKGKQVIPGANRLPENKPQRPNKDQAPDDRDPRAQYEEKSES